MQSENKCITVYVPDSLENNNVGFLPGFIRKDGHDVKFYINDDRLRNDSQGCIGYCGLAQVQPFDQQQDYWIRVSFSNGQFQVSHILCDQIQEYKLLYVFYDFKAFKQSNLTFLSLKPNNEFYYLCKSLSQKAKLRSNNGCLLRFLTWLLLNIRLLCQEIKKHVKFLHLSSIFQHTEGTLTQIHCIVEEISRKGSLSIRAKHVIVTRALDVVLGVLVLQWLLSFQGESPLEHAEALVTRIGDLLRFLMGSPVGLKLNAAFNKTLGRFFLYHMSLWNTFLQTVLGLVDLRTLCGICWLGLSYQLAAVSDLLAVATFHVHCIYVYAARLYGAQVYGLVALWRLFLGRKRNPLKGRVDTYKYSSRQLFVGTLAFTILLFLLPTTGLYYLVFVALRLILLAISKLLSTLRSCVLRAPVYLTLLWLVNSARVRSELRVSAQASSGACALHATLTAGPWRSCALQPTFATLPACGFTEKARKMGLLATIAYGDLL